MKAGRRRGARSRAARRPRSASPATWSWRRSPTRSTRASACGRSSATSAPTPRSSPSRPSSRSRSPTRDSSGSRSRLRGRAAHGSRPHLGVDAIAHGGPDPRPRIGDARLAASRERPHPLLGRGSIHASLIEGGDRALAPIPTRCSDQPGAAHPARRGLRYRSRRRSTEILAAAPRPRPGPRDLAADAAGSRAVRDRRRTPSVVAIAAAAASADGILEPPRSAAPATGPTPRSSARPAFPDGPVRPRAARARTPTEEWVSLSSCEAVRATLVDVARHVCR